MANSQARLKDRDQELPNQRVVTALYEALITKDVDTVHRLLAPDLEWWFHGPPMHQHLMRLLTGSLPPDSFIFIPQSMAAFGSTVVVEGHDKERSVSWVHAWTVNNGIITRVREYFNTAVTVTRFGVLEEMPKPAESPEIGSQSVSCQSVWQSKLCSNKSVPGLVLALS